MNDLQFVKVDYSRLSSELQRAKVIAQQIHELESFLSPSDQPNRAEGWPPILVTMAQCLLEGLKEELAELLTQTVP